MRQIKLIIQLAIAKIHLWVTYRNICECSAIIELTEQERIKTSRALIYLVDEMSKRKKFVEMLSEKLKEV